MPAESPVGSIETDPVSTWGCWRRHLDLGGKAGLPRAGPAVQCRHDSIRHALPVRSALVAFLSALIAFFGVPGLAENEARAGGSGLQGRVSDPPVHRSKPACAERAGSGQPFGAGYSSRGSGRGGRLRACDAQAGQRTASSRASQLSPSTSLGMGSGSNDSTKSQPSGSYDHSRGWSASSCTGWWDGRGLGRPLKSGNYKNYGASPIPSPIRPNGGARRGASRLALRAAPGSSGPSAPGPRSAFRSAFGLTRLPRPWHGFSVVGQSRARARLAGVSGRHSPKANSYQPQLSKRIADAIYITYSLSCPGGRIKGFCVGYPQKVKEGFRWS